MSRNFFYFYQNFRSQDKYLNRENEKKRRIKTEIQQKLPKENK